jgi:TonB-dependent starch-binding outer membrane protein SusC
MKKRMYVMLTMFLLGFLLTGAITAQGTKVSGKVTDAADGSALPGVTLLEKGTSNGTMSDASGTYSLSVGTNATLVVSMVGYLTQEIPVNGRATIDISMSLDVQNLQEVVVIGYGTVAKKDATGSVVAVGTRDFNKGSASRPQDLIMGKIPGVQIVSDGGNPTGGATIRIRGGSSLSASNDPLIVIDGVPVDNNAITGMGNALSLVNSNDIESFTVLKDASATAIFGSRASNGVIIITTKKGLAGKPVKVTYDGSFSFGNKTGQIDNLNALEFRGQMLTKYAPTSAQALLMGKANTDWQKQIYQTATSLDHSLGFSGSVKNIPYRASVGYTDQTGILKTSGLQRLTASLNVNPSFLDNHLTVNVGAKYVNIKTRFADLGAIGNAVSFDPTQAVYDPASSKYGGYFTWKQPSGDPIFVGANRNPLAQLEQTNNRAFVNRLLGNVQVDYKLHFLPDLKITVNAGADYSMTDESNISPQNTAWYYNASEGYGRYGTRAQTKKNELLDVYGNYKKEIASISSRIELTAGYSWQHFYREGADYTTNYAKSVVPPFNDTKYFTENYLVSFFGRLNYVFKDKYLLTATLRDDGSSKFASENRWGLFPSVALAWDIKEEGFLSGVGLINALKLRLGYGITGQQDLSDNNYPYLASYSFGLGNAQYQFGNEFVTTIRPSGYDRNLKWEETTTYNVGLDFGILNNKLSGSLELYYRPTKDLINTIDVPAGTNLTNRITTNVGNLVNKGVELSLNFMPVQTNSFDWSVGMNFTANKNEITKLTALDDPTFIGVETGGISGGVGNNIQIHSVGYPVSSFYMAQQVYDVNGNPIDNLFVDRNGDGNVTSYGLSDRYHIKKPAPDLLVGFTSQVRYKNFDFSFNGRLSLGNYVYNNVASGSAYSNLYNSAGALSNLNSSILKTKFANPQYWSDYFLENGSFLRLDNMTLGYNFENFAEKTGRLRVYANVQNLFVLTKYSGLDPEVFNGIDNNIYPRPRTFMFGVNLEF